MKKINILIVGTKKYYDFALDLIESINKYFLINHKIHIFLFTDREDPSIKNVTIIKTPHKDWPGMTLLRYHLFCDSEDIISDCDYMYYIDADMKVIKPIGDEIIGDRVNVMHVGYYDKPRNEWDYDRCTISNAYIPYGKGDMYYHATLIGANRDNFITMSHTINDWVESDIMKGTVPIWHDESYLNFFLYKNPPTKVLDPGYAFFYHWKQNAPFEPKIININKNETDDIINLRCKKGNFLFNEIMSRVGTEKYDLSDTTIIFFVKKDSINRIRNLNTVIRYLDKYFNSNYLVVEIDEEENINISDLFFCENMRKIFIKNKSFDILKNIKDICCKVNTPYIVLHDTDAIILLDSYIFGRYGVSNGYYDAMYLHIGMKLDINQENYVRFKQTYDIGSMIISYDVNKYQYVARNPKNKKPFFPIICKKEIFKNFLVDIDLSSIDSQFLYLRNWFDRNNYNYMYLLEFYFSLMNDNHRNKIKDYGDIVSYQNKLVEEYFKKFISIIIITNNNEKTIEECVSSILNQTYNNLEIIIIDRFSFDGTDKIIKKMKRSFSRIKYIRVENNIEYDEVKKIAFNLINFNKSDYILIHDPNHKSYNNKLEILISEFDKNNCEDAIGSLLMKDGKFEATEYLYEGIYKNYYKGNMICTSGTLLRSKVFKQFRNFNYSNDYELWSEYLLSGNRIINIPKVLTEELNKYSVPYLDLDLAKIRHINSLIRIKEEEKKYNIGVLIIGTDKYFYLAKNLIKTIREKFLTHHNVKIFFFTNKIDEVEESKDVIPIYQENLGWPEITLFRYKILYNNRDKFIDTDYIYYIDADTLVVDEVGDEILGDLVGVKHPFFWDSPRKEFTYENDSRSLAYISDRDGKFYFHGSFQGGNTREFIRMCKKLMENIDIDSGNGIVAKWHDESHLNRYFIDNIPDKILDPAYSFHEDAKKMEYFIPKIKVIKKDNNRIRNPIQELDGSKNISKYIIKDNENDVKTDFKNVSFIIPVYIDTREKLDNLNLVVSYLDYYFDTNIYIGDCSDKEIIFDNIISKRINYIDCKDLRLNRSGIIDRLVKKSTRNIICIHSPNCLINFKQYIDSVNLILNENNDVIIPHNGFCKNIPRKYYPLIDNTKRIDLFESHYSYISTEKNNYRHGGVLFMKKNVYKKIISNCNWNNDDEERYMNILKENMKISNLNIGRSLYRINHFNTNII